jgi:hypothetical protein
MTLIVSRIMRNWVTQASDRLITRSSNGRVENVDPSSNKTVIFEATDGIACVSFTGLAVLEGVPTDHWIAERLWGAPLDVAAGQLAASRPVRKHDMKTGIELVAGALDAAYAAAPLGYASVDLTIAVAGWRMRRGHYRPFFLVITHYQRDGHSLIHRYKDFGDRKPELLGRRQPIPEINATPSNVVRSVDFQRFFDAIARSEFQDELGILARLYGAVASTNVTVSSDLIAVTIPPPSRREVIVFYHERNPQPVELDIMGVKVTEVVTFVPWMVCSNHVISPGIIGGSQPSRFTLNEFVVIVMPIVAERKSGLLSSYIPLPRQPLT